MLCQRRRTLNTCVVCISHRSKCVCVCVSTRACLRVVLSSQLLQIALCNRCFFSCSFVFVLSIYECIECRWWHLVCDNSRPFPRKPHTVRIAIIKTNFTADAVRDDIPKQIVDESFVVDWTRICNASIPKTRKKPDGKLRPRNVCLRPKLQSNYCVTLARVSASNAFHMTAFCACCKWQAMTAGDCVPMATKSHISQNAIAANCQSDIEVIAPRKWSANCRIGLLSPFSGCQCFRRAVSHSSLKHARAHIRPWH